MITTTLGALALAEDVLRELRTRRLEPVVAYRVALLLEQVGQRLVHYHTIHTALVNEFGAERATTPEEQAAFKFGATVTEVLPANLGDFRLRLRELHAEPVEINLSPLDIATLGSEPMTAAEMDVLRPLLVSNNGHGGSAHG